MMEVGGRGDREEGGDRSGGVGQGLNFHRYSAQ